jgi:hypothetical protein
MHPLPGTYRVGPFELTGLQLPHFVPTAGIRVQADEIALAYSGDTGPDPLLAELGRDTDLFILEATDRDGEAQRPARNLITSAEAGTGPGGRAPAGSCSPTSGQATTGPPRWPLLPPNSTATSWRPKKTSSSGSASLAKRPGPRPYLPLPAPLHQKTSLPRTETPGACLPGRRPIGAASWLFLIDCCDVAGWHERPGNELIPRPARPGAQG